MTTPDFVLILARLEVKLDHLIAESSDHEIRIRNLESRRWPLPVVAVICSVMSMAGTAIIYLVQP